MNYFIVSLLAANFVLLIIILVRHKNPEAGSDFLENRISEMFSRHERLLQEEMCRSRQESKENEKSLREEVQNSFQRHYTLINDTFRKFELSLNELIKNSHSEQEKIGKMLQESSAENRKELSSGLKSFEDKFTGNIDRMIASQKEKLHEMIEKLAEMQKAVTENLESNRQTVELKMSQLQKDNNEKLEKMRETVDEKLQSTLQRRIGESFKLVSEQLDKVQRGLGEMQNLANGVGDLKRVLTNVKERGTWGEVQLGAILEQMLSPEQYEKNVQIKGMGETVEYAVKLPGRDQDNSVIWLPIDAKFPRESYERLLDASEKSDKESVDKEAAELIRAVKKSARDINEKYIAPPHSTDFAIMFLPTEGLYSEVLRVPGVMEELQQKYRIVIAGPTTLTAVLTSLRMGFRTMAIEKRASEVWKVLAAVKTEFGKFGDVLKTLKKQVQSVSNTLDRSEVRTRAMARKLRGLDELPEEEAPEILGIESMNNNLEEDDNKKTETTKK